MACIRLPWLRFEVPPANEYDLFAHIGDAHVRLTVATQARSSLEEEVRQAAHTTVVSRDVTLAGLPAVELETDPEYHLFSLRGIQELLGMEGPLGTPRSRTRLARGPRGEALRLYYGFDAERDRLEPWDAVACALQLGDVSGDLQLGPVGMADSASLEIDAANASYRGGASIDVSVFDETSLSVAHEHLAELLRRNEVEGVQREVAAAGALRVELARGLVGGYLDDPWVFGLVDGAPRRVLLQVACGAPDFVDPALSGALLDTFLRSVEAGG